MPITRLVKLPDFIDDETAAAVILKGLTAQYLIRGAHPVSAGETILIQAAAGGVGLIMCQWARHLGARVIGTVSTAEKAELAKAHGCGNPKSSIRRKTLSRACASLTDGKGYQLFTTVSAAARSRPRSPVCAAAALCGRMGHGWADPAIRSVPPQPNGLAVCDQCRACGLSAHLQRNAGTRRRSVRRSQERRSAHLGQAALSARRRSACASRSQHGGRLEVRSAAMNSRASTLIDDGRRSTHRHCA